jgi:hypothetical protein
MDWRCGSSYRVLALQIWNPEFKSQSCQKKKGRYQVQFFPFLKKSWELGVPSRSYDTMLKVRIRAKRCFQFSYQFCCGWFHTYGLQEPLTKGIEPCVAGKWLCQWLEEESSSSFSAILRASLLSVFFYFFFAVCQGLVYILVTTGIMRASAQLIIDFIECWKWHRSST